MVLKASQELNRFTLIRLVKTNEAQVASAKEVVVFHRGSPPLEIAHAGKALVGCQIKNCPLNIVQSSECLTDVAVTRLARVV